MCLFSGHSYDTPWRGDQRAIPHRCALCVCVVCACVYLLGIPMTHRGVATSVCFPTGVHCVCVRVCGCVCEYVCVCMCVCVRV